MCGRSDACNVRAFLRSEDGGLLRACVEARERVAAVESPKSPTRPALTSRRVEINSAHG